MEEMVTMKMLMILEVTRRMRESMIFVMTAMMIFLVIDAAGTCFVLPTLWEHRFWYRTLQHHLNFQAALKETHAHTLAALNFEVTVETVNKSITNIASIICLLVGLFARVLLFAFRVSMFFCMITICWFERVPGAIRREISIHDGVLVLCLLVRINHPAFDIGLA